MKPPPELSPVAAGVRGIRMVLQQQLARALRHLRGARIPRIHQARKCIKAARATLRLLRCALGERRFERENRALRDAGRLLGPLRDATSLACALQGLLPHVTGRRARRAAAVLTQHLAARLARVRHEGTRSYLHAAHSTIHAVTVRVKQWTPLDPRWGAVEQGLLQTYRRGRKRAHQVHAHTADTRLHEWRKASKHLQSQLRLIAPVQRATLAARAAQLHRLTDCLGEDHDLAGLEECCRAAPRGLRRRDAAQLRKLIRKRRAKLQRRARVLGRHVYAERPRRWAARLERYFKYWPDS
jgi:CHAD domain-containing protein